MRRRTSIRAMLGRSLSARLRGFEGAGILAQIDALADMVKAKK